MKQIKREVGKPDNSQLNRRLLIYGGILVAMAVLGTLLFKVLLHEETFDGIIFAWFTLFIPATAVLMLFGIRRDLRRRWGLAYMKRYVNEAKKSGVTDCPRCGGTLEKKLGVYYRRRFLYSRTSSSGQRTDYYQRERVEYFYWQCDGDRCQLVLEDPSKYTRAVIPYKKKHLRALVLDDPKGYTRSRPNANELLMPRFFLVSTVLVLAIVAFGAFKLYDYTSTTDTMWDKTDIAAEASMTEEELTSTLLSLDSKFPNVAAYVTTSTPDFYTYTFGGKQPTAWVETGMYQGERVYSYRFYGNDFGTGLADGEYMLRSYNGQPVLVSSATHRLYKADSEFYKTYAPKLRALTYDMMMQTALDKVAGGEHGTNGDENYPYEILAKDGAYLWAAVQPNYTGNTGYEVNAIVKREDGKIDEYAFTHSDRDYDDMSMDLEGYTFDAGAVVDAKLDELFATTNRAGGMLTWKTGDKATLRVSVDVYPTGYLFEFRNASGIFEEDVIYRVDTDKKTLTKIAEDNTETAMSPAQHQKDYDYLLSLVPETYIANHIDMSKTEEESQYFGIAKFYRMKDENGKVTAELQVGFGTLQGMVHYLSDTETVEIGLD